MPELPEIETIRRQLALVVVGTTITRLQTYHSRYWLPDLRGQQIVGVGRRGKYLSLELAEGSRVVLHLGMTGQLTTTTRPLDHVCLELQTTTGQIFFRDPRRFGSARFYQAGSHPGGVYATLGQEPLAKSFDLGKATTALSNSSAPIKARLLSQRAIAGVGNYIADEALHRSGLHPARRSFTESELTHLVQEVRAVIRESVRHGGVSERDYVRPDGSRGRYQLKLRCYGRAGLPCMYCATPLTKIVVAGRGSTFCPTCQQCS